MCSSSITAMNVRILALSKGGTTVVGFPAMQLSINFRPLGQPQTAFFRPPERPQESLGLLGGRGRLQTFVELRNFSKKLQTFFRFDDFFLSFSSAVAGLSSYVQCWHFRLGQRLESSFNHNHVSGVF